ncbi:hypothetical protein K2173_004011 [Erythroxylum novogranatense]|uniref:Uncharacterized protein n=1 Tax=Erythroxylum novogranatense TaxID=1862640 RepID=A0AAV8SJZ5_9ROSI|nr:hypothetical protein K2173_004011 [Erythroxylum novogranatense]
MASPMRTPRPMPWPPMQASLLAPPSKTPRLAPAMAFGSRGNDDLDPPSNGYNRRLLPQHHASFLQGILLRPLQRSTPDMLLWQTQGSRKLRLQLTRRAHLQILSRALGKIWPNMRLQALSRPILRAFLFQVMGQSSPLGGGLRVLADREEAVEERLQLMEGVEGLGVVDLVSTPPAPSVPAPPNPGATLTSSEVLPAPGGQEDQVMPLSAKPRDAPMGGTNST